MSAENQLPAGKRGLVYVILSCVCLMWMFIAFGTRVYTIEGSGSSETWSDIWYSCSRGNSDAVAGCVYLTDKNIDCVKLEDHIRATRAFYILTAVFVVVSLAAGLVDMFGSLEGLPGGLGGAVVLAVCSAVVIVWSVLAWALCISYPRTIFCSTNAAVDSDTFRWEASPFMMLMLTITAIIQLVLALVFPGGPAAKTAA
uniref:Amastin n=1 Tax=Neobodo designis TaxID=312471 RepID=A0A7S1LB30_NEODS